MDLVHVSQGALLSRVCDLSSWCSLEHETGGRSFRGNHVMSCLPRIVATSLWPMRSMAPGQPARAQELPWPALRSCGSRAGKQVQVNIQLRSMCLKKYLSCSLLCPCCSLSHLA